MNTQSIRNRLTLLQAAITAQAAQAADPLDATCAAFQVDMFGNVTGLKIIILPIPGATYGVYRVHVRGTVECQGNANVYAKVLDANGVEGSTSSIKKLWPYPEFNAEDSPAGDGNGKGEHEISSKFRADLTIGPLGFGVYGPDGELISDVVVGFGQAEYHPHVGGDIVFKQRSGVSVPDPEPTPLPSGDALERLATAFERLVTHWGA